MDENGNHVTLGNDETLGTFPQSPHGAFRGTRGRLTGKRIRSEGSAMSKGQLQEL